MLPITIVKKYRIPSARAQWWDYGNDGVYFITICTNSHEHFFGDIIVCGDDVTENKMKLSQIGQIADHIWNEIPKYFSFVDLGEYVVMPNHVHGIIIIDNKCNGNGDGIVETRLIASLRNAPNHCVNNHCVNNKIGGFAKNKNPMLHNNLSHVIKWYNGRCTFDIRKIDSVFKWQPRFHDHIIRNSQEYQRIANYIIKNPQNWGNDKLNK